MNENDNLKERYTRFLKALGVPVTAFSRLADVSPSTLYKWRSGLLRLSEDTQRRIDQQLSRFGF